MRDHFEMTIGSDVNLHGLTVEVYTRDDLICVLTQEQVDVVFDIEILPCSSGRPWELDYSRFQHALALAVSKLLDVHPLRKIRWWEKNVWDDPEGSRPCLKHKVKYTGPDPSGSGYRDRLQFTVQTTLNSDGSVATGTLQYDGLPFCVLTPVPPSQRLVLTLHSRPDLQPWVCGFTELQSALATLALEMFDSQHDEQDPGH